MINYYNANGLERGLIPPGHPCPFIGKCGRRDDRCPSESHPKTCYFSCALARGFSLVTETERKKDVEETP